MCICVYVLIASGMLGTAGYVLRYSVLPGVASVLGASGSTGCIWHARYSVEV